MPTKDQYKLLKQWHLAAISAFFLVALCPPTVRAQAPGDIYQFQVRLSEKEKRLDDLGAAALRRLQSDTDFQRTVDLNTPFVELKNDSPDHGISEFRMTIGDERFHFGDAFLRAFAKIGKTTPDIEITADVEEDGNWLIVSFDKALPAGDYARFRIDLDVDDEYLKQIGTSLPNYRSVLFGYEPYPGWLGDVAKVQVTYDDGSVVPRDWAPFQDTDAEEETEAVKETVTFNGTGGCCAGFGSAGGCCCGFGRGSGNGIGGGPGTSGGQALYDPNEFVATAGVLSVPEPAGIVLSVLGLLGGMGICRRQRLSRGR